MSVITVRHSTVYRYGEPVRLGEIRNHLPERSIAQLSGYCVRSARWTYRLSPKNYGDESNGDY